MRIRSLLPSLAVAGALVALPATVAAHAHFTGSTPEAGSNLDSAPSEVVITFDDELDPDGSSFTVTDHHGHEVGSGGVDLDVAARDTLRGAVTITEPGIYTVSYAVRGLDGHDVPGEFSFGYRAEDPVPTSDSHDDHDGSPDTAMPVPGTGVPAVTLLGLSLLIGGGLLAARRRSLR